MSRAASLTLAAFGAICAGALARTDGHASLVNRAALDAAGLTSSSSGVRLASLPTIRVRAVLAH